MSKHEEFSKSLLCPYNNIPLQKLHIFKTFLNKILDNHFICIKRKFICMGICMPLQEYLIRWDYTHKSFYINETANQSYYFSKNAWRNFLDLLLNFPNSEDIIISYYPISARNFIPKNESAIFKAYFDFIYNDLYDLYIDYINHFSNTYATSQSPISDIQNESFKNAINYFKESYQKYSFTAFNAIYASEKTESLTK